MQNKREITNAIRSLEADEILTVRVVASRGSVAANFEVWRSNDDKRVIVYGHNRSGHALLGKLIKTIFPDKEIDYRI